MNAVDTNIMKCKDLDDLPCYSSIMKVYSKLLLAGKDIFLFKSTPQVTHVMFYEHLGGIKTSRPTSLLF